MSSRNVSCCDSICGDDIFSFWMDDGVVVDSLSFGVDFIIVFVFRCWVLLFVDVVGVAVRRDGKDAVNACDTLILDAKE